jgi:hypothetical protein
MTQTLTDHDSIKRWAREHGARPALVKGTARDKDANALQLAMEGTSQEGRLEPIDWDAWFQRFDENGLALIVDDSAGAASANKLVPRGSATARQAATKRGAASDNKPAAADDEDDDLFDDSEDELDDEFDEDEEDRD